MAYNLDKKQYDLPFSNIFTTESLLSCGIEDQRPSKTELSPVFSRTFVGRSWSFKDQLRPTEIRPKFRLRSVLDGL
jgi:hypothetical protein